MGQQLRLDPIKVLFHRPYSSPLVEEDEVLLAPQSQDVGIRTEESTAPPDAPPPVPLYPAPAPTIHCPRAPVISVDTKEKELIGRFKNPGERWQRHAQAVNDHDFRSDVKGMAILTGYTIPSGITDSWALGTSRETPAFAVDVICLWWQCCGQKHYPGAQELLILADSGGGNGARVRAWKYHLQHKLANRYQLTVTVTHYPRSSSKWNPIEHRLFSQISSNWEATPLPSYELMVNYIPPPKPVPA